MKIDINKKPHQDNLKAEIYHQFKCQGYYRHFSMRCEHKFCNCRFDMVAYDSTTLEIFALIEVRRIDAKKPPRVTGNKHIKYSAHGCKLFYISQFDKIEELLNDIFYHKQSINAA